ncbi:hypothetical protein DPMN_013409 [Dreissena polymorpha]|uniref:Uncharacterized protein n=1 Tax=Dreissena polymorpha TaxID=45954 RepID=A0A9D4N5E5_DREPO|nr:hypothetical protein DPMN_013409 [Dreissena polymorpha]
MGHLKPGCLSVMKSLHDDLQSWTTFSVGRPSELGDLQSWTTFRVGPPSELDDHHNWTTSRVRPPSELNDLQR